MEKFDSLYSILTTIGKHGIVYTTREEDIDRSIKLGPNSQLYNEDYSNKKVCPFDNLRVIKNKYFFFGI